MKINFCCSHRFGDLRSQMGKKSKTDAAAAAGENDADVDAADFPQPAFITPIAKPRLEGKTQLRAMRVLRRCATWEATAGDGGAALKAGARQIKRGVAEVTKALRKGSRGIVLIALDVAPLDIIAHLPVFCEEKEVRYGFVGTKKALGAMCKTPRPASVVMVCKPNSEKLPYADLYAKLDEALISTK